MALRQRLAGQEVVGEPGGVALEHVGGPQVQPGPPGGRERVVEGGTDEGVDEAVRTHSGLFDQADGQGLVHGHDRVVLGRTGHGGEGD